MWFTCQRSGKVQTRTLYTLIMLTEVLPKGQILDSNKRWCHKERVIKKSSCAHTACWTAVSLNLNLTLVIYGHHASDVSSSFIWRTPDTLCPHSLFFMVSSISCLRNCCNLYFYKDPFNQNIQHYMYQWTSEGIPATQWKPWVWGLWLLCYCELWLSRRICSITLEPVQQDVYSPLA